MTALSLSLRQAHHHDLYGVDILLARSYPRLLKADYPPSVMVTAVPLLARANPRLVMSGRYYVVETPEGRIVGAGGWSVKGRAAAEVRHVAVDPDFTRHGIGRQILKRVVEAATQRGTRRLDCLATRTAVPFYTSVGFRQIGPVEIALSAGISFPAVAMARPL